MYVLRGMVYGNNWRYIERSSVQELVYFARRHHFTSPWAIYRISDMRCLAMSRNYKP